MSWAEAVAAAEAYHQALYAKSGDSEIEELLSDKEEYLNLDESGTWWKLTGETCLTREGDLMGHCVGDYIHDVESGHSIIMSLRDSKNNPHVTVELRPTSNLSKQEVEIVQIKGKENEPPVKKYWSQVDELIKKLSADMGGLFVADGEMGYDDLEGCGITAFGSVFVRTNQDINKAQGWYRILASPEYVEGYKNMPEQESEGKGTLDEIIEILSNGMIGVIHDDDEDYIQAWKMNLVVNGHWNMETETSVLNPKYDPDKHDELDPTNPQSWIDGVPVSVSVGLPGVEHEVLAGDPEATRQHQGYRI
jgi:hypothetical protein